MLTNQLANALAQNAALYGHYGQFGHYNQMAMGIQSTPLPTQLWRIYNNSEQTEVEQMRQDVKEWLKDWDK